MTQSGQGEEPSARQAREGIVLPSDGGEPLLPGLADTPVGLAAWLLDHNDADGQPAAAVAKALNRTSSTTGELTREEGRP